MTIRDFKTPAEAALKAGVTQRCVNDWVRRYPGLAHKVGGRWRINPDALARLLGETGEASHVGESI